MKLKSTGYAGHVVPQDGTAFLRTEAKIAAHFRERDAAKTARAKAAREHRLTHTVGASFPKEQG